MPPKRKAAAAPKTEEPAPKRQTRATACTTTVSSSTKKDGPAPAKAKGKAKKEVIAISDSDEDGVMVVEEQSKPKKSAPKKEPKKPAEKKEKAPPKPKATKSKAAIAGKTSADASASSTSTPPIVDPPAAKPKVVATKPKSPKKPVSWEQGCKDWFAKFADEDEPGKIGGEGIEKLFDEMGVSMEGVLPFLLAWELNAKAGSFGSYYLSDFLTAFREPKINSTPALKTYLLSVEKTLYPSTTANSQQNAQFRNFYTFLFPFLKEEGQKSLNGEMATVIWGIVLAPKYPTAKAFVEYATSLGPGFKGVSSDVWSQLLEFVQTVGIDLSGWSEEDAWPSTIDSFVEWKKAQVKA